MKIYDSAEVQATDLPKISSADIWGALLSTIGKTEARKLGKKITKGQVLLSLVLVDPRKIKSWYHPVRGTVRCSEVLEMRQAIRNGAQMPPVVIDSCRKVLWEGRHRTTASACEGVLVWAIDLCSVLPSEEEAVEILQREHIQTLRR